MEKKDTKSTGKKSGNKRQRILLMVLGALVVGGGVYYVLVINATPSLPSEGINEQVLSIELGIELRDPVPELSMHVIEHPAVEAFRTWNSLPLEVGDTGKANPFSR